MSDPVAVIDCGTNAIRLLVAGTKSSGGIEDLVREMRTVRLGEGVDRTGEFSRQALDRTFVACREYAEIIAQFNVGKKRFIATSASRDVSNKHDFISGVESILGVTPEVISGTEEAELSYLGAVSGFDPEPQQPILVADIGGGSTEFVMRGSPSTFITQSINVGCVRMTERYLHSDPPTESEIAQTIDEIHRGLNQVRSHLPIHKARTLIGLAGSVTTVAAMSLGLNEYNPLAIHGTVLSLDQVQFVTDQLLHMSRADRAQLGFMHPGRVDVIGGGALILRESMSQLNFPRVVVSEHDLLDGVVALLTA